MLGPDQLYEGKDMIATEPDQSIWRQRYDSHRARPVNMKTKIW